MIHIYCGDGKGKTTAALGLALRAAGRGKKILIARFLKNDDSGEISILSGSPGIPGITVIPCEKSFGFYFRMDEETKRQAAEYYQELFQKAVDRVSGFGYDMLILDEIMAAVNYGMVSEQKVLSFLTAERQADLEIVMTGRNPSEAFLKLADYVTEMKMVKHPYERGIGARKGIEY